MRPRSTLDPKSTLAAHAAAQLSEVQARMTGTGAVLPVDPAPAPKPAEKTAPKPAKSVRPWEKADPESFVGNTIKIPMPLYEKINWMKLNVPGPDRSIQKIAVAALEHWADLQIKKHWKDG